MLDKLRQVGKKANRRFPGPGDPGIGRVGLILCDELKNGGYISTPTNSLAFAVTGGEGVHFSFLLGDAGLQEDSPVIVTNPDAFGSENFIVGESLYEFLCLGMHRGYFALEQLGYAYEEAVEVYSDPTWQPKTERHESVGYGIDADKRAILQFLTEELHLAPWKNVKERLAALAAKYKGCLKMPKEYYTS